MRALSLVVLSFALLAFKGQQPPASDASYTVTVFMAPKCNICKYYTPALKELHAAYSTKGVSFQGVFPNAHSTPELIEEFGKEFSIPFILQQDSSDLVSLYAATVTPEVVVTNASGQVMYQGRIDNSYVRVGKRRTRTSSSELADALKALTSGKEVKVKNTPAIGCIIERKR